MKPPTWPLYRLTETEDVNGLVAGKLVARGVTVEEGENDD